MCPGRVGRRVPLEPALLALRLELIHLSWDHAAREVEIHKSRHLQLFAVSLTVGLTAVASVLLDRIPVGPGLGFAVLMGGIAGYAQIRLLRLPAWLQRAHGAGVRAIGSLMGEEAD